MPILRTHIVPHPPLIVSAVGHGREKEIQSTVDAYRRVADSIAADQPDLIVFITPHGAVYGDYIHIAPGRAADGSFQRFGAPEARYTLTYDEILIKHVSILAQQMNIPAGTLGGKDARHLDHGTMVPMHFINAVHADYKAARISISGLPFETHYHFGQCLQAAIDGLDRRAVIVASGDLSHKLTTDGPYGFAPEGPAFDQRLCAAMRQSDFLSLLQFDSVFCDKAAECGLRSFIIMAGALDGFDAEASFYSYEGPFGVGYALCTFTPGGINNERRFLEQYTQLRRLETEKKRRAEDAYVRLARETLESYVRTGRIPPLPDALPAEMLTQKAGTFVSIKKNGRLRGCIGTTEPYRQNIAEEIIGNAISAGTSDPRFDAIVENELSSLTYSVDVLSPAEPVSGEDALDVQRYGVIVTSGRKRGLLLPHLEGVDTVAQQISIAKQKAGIMDGESYTLSRFEVVRHV